MIQRIQSLYLLIVAVLMALMCFLPVGVIYDNVDNMTLTALGFHDANGATVIFTYALTATVAVSSLLALVAIFLFKNRMAQFRLCVVVMILLVGAVIFEAYYLLNAVAAINADGAGATNLYVKIAGAFPLVALIFTYLALRGVKKDIMLVKSLDRIR